MGRPLVESSAELRLMPILLCEICKFELEGGYRCDKPNGCLEVRFRSFCCLSWSVGRSVTSVVQFVESSVELMPISLCEICKFELEGGKICSENGFC